MPPPYRTAAVISVLLWTVRLGHSPGVAIDVFYTCGPPVTVGHSPAIDVLTFVHVGCIYT